MLDIALKFLKDKLEPNIRNMGDGDMVILGAIVNGKGELLLKENKLGIALVNLEEERVLKNQLQRELRTDNKIRFANPEIKLNLLLMMAVNPGDNNYTTALSILSQGITFFQGNTFFEQIPIPDSDDKIEELIVELYSLNIEQQNQLWASLGAKYLPSVVYRVRLIVIANNNFSEPQRVIGTADYELKRIN